MKKSNAKPADKKMIIVFVILMIAIIAFATSSKSGEQAPAEEDQYTPRKLRGDLPGLQR